MENTVEPGQFLEIGGATDGLYWQSQPRCYARNLTMSGHAEMGEQNWFRWTTDLTEQGQRGPTCPKIDFITA